MGVTMSAEAAEARRAYQRAYLRKNRDKINSQRKNWRAENRDKVQQYNREYWERRAGKAKNLRAASWEQYGISEKRYHELKEMCQSGKYDDLVRAAAHTAAPDIEEYIYLSVTKKMSYRALEVKWQLGEMERMPYNHNDFYGYRRLFYHYLDCALKDEKTAAREERHG